MDAIPGTNSNYRTRVFGHEAIEEMKELASVRVKLWDSSLAVRRIHEVTGANRETEVATLLQKNCSSILVIRKKSPSVTDLHALTLRKFAGNMAMECQGVLLPSATRQEPPFILHVSQFQASLILKPVANSARNRVDSH